MAYFCDDGTIRDGDDADAKFVAKPRAHLSLARQTEQYKHAFVKDMAYFITGRYEEYVDTVANFRVSIFAALFRLLSVEKREERSPKNARREVRKTRGEESEKLEDTSPKNWR